MRALGPPPPRDVADTGFSSHLDALLRQVPEALCAVFVDGEGEAVDMASRVDAFDARIAAAELAIVLSTVRGSSLRQRQGEVLEVRLEGPERSLIARHVSGGYDLVVLVTGDAISARAAELTAATAIALMAEAGLDPPVSYALMRTVEQRPSSVGFAIPTAFEENGVKRRVVAILGHRADGPVAKFLVRLDNGEELVLSNQIGTVRWERSS